jgi:hypothetical protein
MHSESDISSVYDYLKDTPESALRKMMVANDFNENYFRVLMKIVRACSQAEFIQVMNSETIPKVRLTPGEVPLKEHVWPLAKKKLTTLGLLGPEMKSMPQAA